MRGSFPWDPAIIFALLVRGEFCGIEATPSFFDINKGLSGRDPRFYLWSAEKDTSIKLFWSVTKLYPVDQIVRKDELEPIINEAFGLVEFFGFERNFINSVEVSYSIK